MDFDSPRGESEQPRGRCFSGEIGPRRGYTREIARKKMISMVKTFLDGGVDITVLQLSQPISMIGRDVYGKVENIFQF